MIMKGRKMFHIACLISVEKDGNEFEEVEIVHENWVSQDRKSCRFPPFMRNQLKKALRNAIPPSSDWKIYEMKILNSYGTYDEALSVAELMSKLDSSDDEMPRKKQKKGENIKSHNSLQEVACALTLNKNLPSSAVDAVEDLDSSNSSIECSPDIDNLLQMTQTDVAKTSDKPILLKLSSNALNNLVSSSSYKNSRSKTNNLVTSSNNRSSILNCEASSSSQSLPTSSSKNVMEIPSVKNFLDWMEEMDERLKKIDLDNARILASLTTNSNEDSENATRNQPLRNQNELADFEQDPRDDENSRKKMDSVKKFLKDCFKNQPDELFENVFKAVSEAGVGTFEDLKYLDTEKDLDGIVKPIQARKLKAKIDEAYSSAKSLSKYLIEGESSCIQQENNESSNAKSLSKYLIEGESSCIQQENNESSNDCGNAKNHFQSKILELEAEVAALKAENAEIQQLRKLNMHLQNQVLDKIGNSFDEEVITGNSNQDELPEDIDLGNGVVLKRSIWSVIKEEPTISKFTKSLSVAIWGDEVLMTRSTTGIKCRNSRGCKGKVEGEEVEDDESEPKPALSPQKLTVISAQMREYMERRKMDVNEIDATLKKRNKFISQKIADLRKREKLNVA